MMLMENKTDPVRLHPLRKKNILFETVEGVCLGGLSGIIGVPILELAMRSNKTIGEWFGKQEKHHLVREAAVIGAGYSVINGFLSFRDAVKYNKELEAIELERERPRPR